ncbi:MAG: hypothetical protein EXS18_05075 [Verrucomicrobiae bacterium]|nr:hypothetical protein [Verrucomicrobiae bacterium]
MELTGSSPVLGGTVKLLVGSNLVGRATMGKIQGILPGQSANSSFDVFFKMILPGGTNVVLFNTNFVRVSTVIGKVPQLDVIYTHAPLAIVTNLTGCVTNLTGCSTNVSCLFTNITGCVTNPFADCVTNILKGVTNITDCVTNVTGCVTNLNFCRTNLTGCATNITGCVTNIVDNRLILYDASSNAAGRLLQIWFAPSRHGKEAKLGVSQDVTGSMTPGTVTTNVCSGSNVLSSTTVTLTGQSLFSTITPNLACDELGLEAGTNFFEAVWNSSLGTNHWRGSHQGTFRILQVINGVTSVFATGTMDGNNGVGTHRSPLPDDCEECAPCSHFEGQLKGKIVAANDLKGGTLMASYAGDFVDSSGAPIVCSPLPTEPPSGPFQMTIDGVTIVKGCLPLPDTNAAQSAQSPNVPALATPRNSGATAALGTRLGFSRNVNGSVTLGTLRMGACADPNDVASASVSVAGQTPSATMTVNTNCDETALISSTNNVLAGATQMQVDWNFNLRAPDWRGTHKGSFSILKGNTVLARGTMEGVNNVGTHRNPPLTNDCEMCDACDHFEGKLRGKIVAPAQLKGALLDATYSGQFVGTQTDPITCCPPPNAPPSGSFRMAIDGVVITKGCITP